MPKRLTKSALFAQQYKGLASELQTAIKGFIRAKLDGRAPFGKDKPSGMRDGIVKFPPYVECGMRHFHLRTKSPDPLLFYQETEDFLYLVAVTTHAQAFESQEDAFWAMIADELLEV